MKKYLLSLNGHGAESVFIRLNEDSFAFWSEKQKEEESFVADYLCTPEDFENIPEEFNFLIKNGESFEWYENDDIFCHFSSPDLDSCYIQVEEIQEDGSSKQIFLEQFSKFREDNEDAIEYLDPEVEYEDIPDHVMECNSYEKGVLFGETFEAEDFDFKLLKILVKEAPNGVEYFDSAYYNGEELDNTEYSTRGKGMEVNLWEK
jgi:hypothetical protein